MRRRANSSQDLRMNKRECENCKEKMELDKGFSITDLTDQH